MAALPIPYTCKKFNNAGWDTFFISPAIWLVTCESKRDFLIVF